MCTYFYISSQINLQKNVHECTFCGWLQVIEWGFAVK